MEINIAQFLASSVPVAAMLSGFTPEQ